MAVDNNTIVTKIWLQGSNDFQQRVPNPTQSSMKDVVDYLFDPMNRNYLNQFIDSLVNRIGKTIVHSQRWENRLRAFKGENLMYGSTIQEIAPKWIKAHSYEDDSETLLKLHRPEAQAWYHSIDRQDRYAISIVDAELRRAFTTEFGLNEFVAAILVVPQNSDENDEYQCMKQLLAFYEDKFGFFKVQADMPTDEPSGKALLTKVKTYAGKLLFPSTLYNASVVKDIPVFAKEEELILIITPEVDAQLAVQTYANLFNVEFAEIKYRVVIIDEFPIPNAVALLTTKDWFIVHDAVYTTTSFYNPETLATTYWLHHHEVVSCSPFVPAILFTSDAGTEVDSVKVDYSKVTLTLAAEKAKASPGDVVKLTPTVTGAEGAITGDDDGDIKIPDAVAYTVALKDAADTGKTYVDRFGKLHIQKTGIEAGDVVTVTAYTVYVNPSGATTTKSATATVTIE